MSVHAPHVSLPLLPGVEESFSPAYMSPTLDPISLAFASWARQARLPVLDVGCGDGVATLAALARGAHVCAVDPDGRSILRLLSCAPHEQRIRLKVRVGSLPGIDFEAGTFEGVHASRVLQNLAGRELIESFQAFFRWLPPGGKLFISAFSHQGAFWDFHRAGIAKRCIARDPWPGYIDDLPRELGRCECAPYAMHLLDERILRREIEAAGFAIEAISTYELPWDHEQTCCGVIARKER